MATFSYSARGPGGKTLRGDIEATSIVEARVKLRAQKMVPVKIAPKGAGLDLKFSFGGGSVPGKDLQIFTRQFATLINSGIPIVQSLAVLSQAAQNKNLKEAVNRIRSEVEQGRRLADSMLLYPKIFDNLYINLVKAGEEGGVLDTVLNRLAVYIEKSNKIIAKVKGAMFYPVAVMIVAGIVVSGLLVFVIPKFESIFKSSGQELPGLTQMVINLSHAFVRNWYFFIVGIGGSVFGIIKYYGSPSGKDFFDAFLIRTPLLGTIIQKNAVARFSRTLSTMLSSGVGVLDALDIAGRTVGNSIMEKTIIKARLMVQEGKSMIVAFHKDRYFPDMVVQMIGVGEQTGALDVMLGKVADFYEDEVEYAVGAMTSMMEPLMMVFLGGIIAVLVVAMYLPIFNLAGGVK
jgi:type IV pilus assembly protein PilC